MTPTEPDAAARPQRADARRNVAALLDGAAKVFVRSGVDAPIRAVAAEAGVSTATIYRHFPTRADLIVAVYRHQVENLVTAGPALSAECATPLEALERWADGFIDFLVTKNGLATALQTDDPRFEPLHTWFIAQLEPVCSALVAATERASGASLGVSGYELMRGIGSICAGAGGDPRYDPRRLARLLLSGVRQLEGAPGDA